MTRHTECLDLPVARRPISVRRLLGETLRNVWLTIRIWNTRYRQRRELLALSDHMLKDIGISRAQAENEGSKAFWE